MQENVSFIGFQCELNFRITVFGDNKDLQDNCFSNKMNCVLNITLTDNK